jgi:tetratricopeptide (TPR) repeat protein
MSHQGDAAAPAPLSADQVVADVTAVVQSGDLNRALRMAGAALARGIVHPLLLNLRAYWLEENNRPREALADLERAVAMAPDDPSLYNALGLCLTRFSRWGEAVEAFEAAVARQPDFVAAHFNLASARECIGDLAGAAQAFERTLELKPDTPEPLSSLANLAARRADWGRARQLAEQALAADPRQYLALTTLASVAVATDDLANAESLIAVALGDPGLPPIHRTMLLTIRGDLRHAERRYADAFDSYTEANNLRRELFAERYAAPGQETAATLTQFLAEYFEEAPASDWSVTGAPVRADGPPVTAHVFLMGFARSGTTLMENILAAHPSVVALDEKEFLVESIREYLFDDKGIHRLASASEDELDRFRKDYWRRVAEHCGDVGGKVLVDKRPMATMKLPVIAKLFPAARVLFAIRDPRDVVLSCFRRQFLLNPSMYEFLELRGAARFYASMMRLSVLCREKFALPWQEIRHERLINDFDAEMRRVFEFAGLAWKDVGDFAETARERHIATPSSTQVIKGLNREGVGQWRHYRDQLGPVFPTLKPWIEKFGYSPH